MDFKVFERFCEYRGEWITPWFNEMVKFERDNKEFIDIEKTNESLARLLDRLKKGEFIVSVLFYHSTSQGKYRLTHSR